MAHSPEVLDATEDLGVEAERGVRTEEERGLEEAEESEASLFPGGGWTSDPEPVASLKALLKVLREVGDTAETVSSLRLVVPLPKVQV